MGTWSHEIFGNDTACDWAAGVAAGDSLRPVEAAIDAVRAAPAGLLDADLAVEGLAAADLVARLRGRPGVSNAYTEALDAWVLQRRLQPPPPLVQAALDALARIGGADSELRLSWDDAGGAAAWLATVDDLRERLAAPPLALVSPVEGDLVVRLVGQVQGLRFELPPAGAEATVGALYQRAVAAAALGDVAAVRDAIARLWQPVARLDKPNVAWDLAVRDAQTLAIEGRLDEALEGLEVWRGAPAADAPGMFTMRAAGVCQYGGDAALTALMREQACAEAPQQRLWRLDAPLHDARAGSPEAAQAALDAFGPTGDDPHLSEVVDFVRGILACRRGDAAALGLLTPVAAAYADKCRQSAGAWALASAAIGWWALALAQTGRTGDARAVAEALRPVLLQPANALLLDLLHGAGVLPAAVEAPPRPARIAFDGPRPTDHGAFRSIAVRGVNALRWVERQRARFAAGAGAYPFLIGGDEGLRRLLAMLSPPADGGRATLDVAADLDAAAWLKERGPRRKPAWPREGPAPHPLPASLFDAATRRLEAVVHVGLVDLAEPCELFARLGFGDWNACPAPAVHVALHRHWRERFGAEPVALTGDTVECIVSRPAPERDAALALARDQAAYCPDIVEQGTGSTGRLGSSLLAAPFWYFWWD